MSDVLGLPFDQYQCHRFGADLLEEVRRADGPLRILEVGGDGQLSAFLPEDEVTSVRLPEPSGTLPFADGAFDAVVALDALEHVAPSEREGVIDECVRTGRAHVVLAGPYLAPEVEQAEALLRSFLTSKLEDGGARAARRAHPLPSREEVERALRQHGAVASFGFGNLARWLACTCVERYLDGDEALRPITERFFRFLNCGVYEAGLEGPHYRHYVVGALGEAALPLPRGAAAPRHATSPDVLRRLTEFGVELAAFDREKDVWSKEFARLRGVIAELEVEHQECKRILGDTQADLREHKLSLLEMQGIRREELACIGELEGTIAGFSEVEADLRGQIAEQDRTRLALEGECARALEDARSIQAELALARAECERHGAQIAELDQTVSDQRRALRNRLQNLARAFAWRKTEF